MLRSLRIKSGDIMTNPRLMKDMLVRASELAPAGYALAFHVDQMRPSFLLHAYPEAWTTIYARKALVMVDPVVAWGLSQEGVCRWSDLTEDPSGVMTLASENGLKFGCVTSLAAGELRTFGGFARSDREFTNDEIEELPLCQRSCPSLYFSSILHVGGIGQ